MPRNKEYDRQEVLLKAVGIFWRNGYKATSMADVVRETGLNTASLYKEFGDKEGLFLEALRYYREHILAHRYKILEDHPNLEGVRKFLESVLTGAAAQKYKGCLMMNHMSQKFTISPLASRQISEIRKFVESLLENALTNAQKNGEISNDKDPAILASFIMSNVHGVVLYGRYPDRKDQLHKFLVLIWQAVTK